MALLTVNFKSEALGMPVVMDALIPQGHGGYRSLYLLHGAGGGHSTWLLKTKLAEYADNTDIAVFMPSGNNKFYVNNLNGKDYFTFITEEIVDKCEKWFNISEQSCDRYIAGMSMGGYGAMYAALNKPDYYNTAFSYSGLLNILERCDKPQGLDIFTVFGTRQQLVENKYNLYDIIVDKCKKNCGNDSGKEKKCPNNAINRNVDKSVDNVDNFCRLVIECGTSDTRINMSREFYKAVSDAGISSFYHEEEGGHDFKYWDRCIERTVKYISEGGIYGSN